MPRGTKYKYEDYHKEINGVLYKKCTLHKKWFLNEDEWLPCTIEYFHVNVKNKTDGLHPCCKRCASKKSSKLQQERPEQYAILKRDWHDRNVDKHSKQKSDWHQAHIDKRKEDFKRFHELNPDKQKIYADNHRDHDITKNEWIANKNFFKNEQGEWCCAYCGMTEKAHKKEFGEQLHKEHVEHNGYNDVRNCVPACGTCNSSKWQHDIEEWFRKQEFFSEVKLNKIMQWCFFEFEKYIESKSSYKITRSRVNREDGTYYYNHELWTVDKYRNIIECVDIQSKKKDLNLNLAINYKKSS